MRPALKIATAPFALVILPLLASASGAAAPTAVGSKIDQVVVYSQEARVFRSAAVTLSGKSGRFVLADLPDTAKADSVQVECASARVSRVSVARERGRLARQQEALALADAVQAVADKIQALDDEREVLQRGRQLMRRLTLHAPDAQKTGPRPVGLFVNAWRQILRWMGRRSEGIETRLVALRGRRRGLEKERHALGVQASKLDLDSVERPVQRVSVELSGAAGRHRVRVSYAVPRVTWRAAYDLRYDRTARRVEAIYYAVVEQRSGEDWKQGKLRFSTATPTRLIRVPELPTWTLGRRRDFTPRPSPYPEPPIRPWVPPTQPVERAGQEALRRLRAVLGHPARPAKAGAGRREAAKRDGLGQVQEKEADDSLEDPAIEGAFDAEKKSQARSEPQPAIAPPPAEMAAGAPAAPSRPARMRRAAPVTRSPKQRPMAQPQGQAEIAYVVSPPPADSPAAAAKGYLFTLYAPGKHDVPASGAKRQIPLLRRRLTGDLIHRVVPGRSEAAYLMAELKNATGRPILAGHANVFTDGLFSGRSWLNTALPGRVLRLPLGVDDSVDVVRHLTQKTVAKGVFFKDDATDYTVAIEIANHQRYPVRIDLREQVPLTQGTKVTIGELKFYRAGKPVSPRRPQRARQSGWSAPDEQGRVRWAGEIAAGKVQKLSFSYRIVRPKDWLLLQHGG